MQDPTPIDHCPDCDDQPSRRRFMGTAAGAALAVAGLPALGLSRRAIAAPSRSADATAVGRLYTSLSDAQRKIVAFPFDDELRKRINPNWHISKSAIGDFSKEQQEIVKEIVKNATSEDGYERFQKQMTDDDGGIENYSFAIFGDPDNGPFEFELTGRHLTLRADGNSVKGAAFGGPIVYGHSKPGNSKENLFSYQTMRADEVFQSFDGKQREKALLAKAPSEGNVQLRKQGRPRPGIALAELSEDQRELVHNVFRDIMKPYRKDDVDEVIEIAKKGGLDNINMAFYQTDDLGDDKVWDIWRLEGPTLVCHFRGAPHVHAYINVAERS